MPPIVIALRKSKFPLGQVVITANARSRLEPADIENGLCRHAAGDWGEVCREDAQSNEHALKTGSRLLSVYGQGNQRFWIITEADRSVTTLLLPMDY